MQRSQSSDTQQLLRKKQPENPHSNPTKQSNSPPSKPRSNRPLSNPTNSKIDIRESLSGSVEVAQQSDNQSINVRFNSEENANNFVRSLLKNGYGDPQKDNEPKGIKPIKLSDPQNASKACYEVQLTKDEWDNLQKPDNFSELEIAIRQSENLASPTVLRQLFFNQVYPNYTIISIPQNLVGSLGWCLNEYMVNFTREKQKAVIIAPTSGDEETGYIELSVSEALFKLERSQASIEDRLKAYDLIMSYSSLATIALFTILKGLQELLRATGKVEGEVNNQLFSFIFLVIAALAALLEGVAKKVKANAQEYLIKIQESKNKINEVEGAIKEFIKDTNNPILERIQSNFRDRKDDASNPSSFFNSKENKKLSLNPVEIVRLLEDALFKDHIHENSNIKIVKDFLKTNYLPDSDKLITDLKEYQHQKRSNQDKSKNRPKVILPVKYNGELVLVYLRYYEKRDKLQNVIFIVLSDSSQTAYNIGSVLKDVFSEISPHLLPSDSLKKGMNSAYYITEAIKLLINSTNVDPNMAANTVPKKEKNDLMGFPAPKPSTSSSAPQQPTGQ